LSLQAKAVSALKAGEDSFDFLGVLDVGKVEKEAIHVRACLISADSKKRRRASACPLIDDQECHAEPPGEGLDGEIVCPYTSWKVQRLSGSSLEDKPGFEDGMRAVAEV
jgi:hypothetical protein